jgi:hypothetical protein
MSLPARQTAVNSGERIQEVVFSSRKKYFTGEAWVKYVEIRKDPAQVSVMWQSRVDLFRRKGVDGILGRRKRVLRKDQEGIPHLDGERAGSKSLLTMPAPQPVVA